MVACQNQKDLWRCGESEYFNGYEAEEPETDSDGDPVYLRDFFPGDVTPQSSVRRGSNSHEHNIRALNSTDMIDEVVLWCARRSSTSV